MSNKKVICPICKEKLVSLEGLYDHILEDHENEIPEEYSPARYYYFLRTGKEHGTCVVCKKDTEWNDATNKYKRFCNNPKCKEKYREIFKSRMINKYGKTSLLDDPEQQRKMLANRKISGIYKWSDGKSTKNYTGSYELDFLTFLDKFMNFDADDIMSPSPHTYYYKFEGNNKFYIPDFFIPSLNLEIEIKDGGDNVNTHSHMERDRKKEKLKDEVLEKQRNVDYIKIVDKNYDGFFKYLLKKKEEIMEDKYANKNSIIKESISDSYTDTFNYISTEILTEGLKNIPELNTPMDYQHLPTHLKNDPIHSWRAKSGIELIHQEPTLQELNRIWNNWNLMNDKQKSISDRKSIELFGVNNRTHYNQLINLYESNSLSYQPIIDFLNEHYVEPNNLFGDIITEGNAIYDAVHKFPIFIVLMHSGTALANAIKKVTGDEFSHACISFNSKLTPLYSFGRKHLDMSETGFVSNSPKDKFFEKFKAKYAVYVMFVDKISLRKMTDRLKFFIQHDPELKYDVVALIRNFFNLPSENERKYFCSRFVADIINAGN